MAHSSTNVRWWKEPDNRKHDALFAALDHIEKRDSVRREGEARHCRLYGGADFAGLGAGEYYRLNDPTRLTFNVIRSVVDTIVAKVTKTMPLPTFLTEFGDYRKQRQAKNLSRFIDGAFYQMKVPRQGRLVFRDGCIGGSGAFKVGSTTRGDLFGERLFPWELYVDQVDGMYGRPRALYHTKLVDKTVLAEKFAGDKREGEIRRAIERSSKVRKEEKAANRDSLADQISVAEGWLLPSYPGADDGSHVIAIPGSTLRDKPWTRPRFPVAFHRFSDRQIGFWGQGIAELLTGTQYEVNVLLQKVQEVFSLHARPIMAVERGSKVRPQHISDEIDIAIEYLNTPPQLLVYPMLPPEFYAQLERYRQQAYEEIGLTMMSATGQKPAGLDAAVAMREHHDIESERFAPVGRGWEDLHLDIAQITIDEARELAEEGKALKVRASDRNEMIEIDWKDVDLKEDAFVMKMFPASSLPSLPSFRLQTVQELISAGFIDPEEGQRLLDFPDLDQHTRLKFAPFELVERQLDEMLHDEKPHMPEPHMPLEWALRRAQATLSLAELQGAPESALELVRNYMTDIEALLAKAAGGGAAGPALPPGVMPEDPAAAAAGAAPLPPEAGAPPGTVIQ